MRRGKKWDAAFNVDVPLVLDPRNSDLMLLVMPQFGVDIERGFSIIEKVKNSNGTTMIPRRDAQMLSVIFLEYYVAIGEDKAVGKQAKAIKEAAMKAFEWNHPDSL